MCHVVPCAYLELGRDTAGSLSRFGLDIFRGFEGSVVVYCLKAGLQLGRKGWIKAI